jgi:hypothetical protein
MSKFKLFIFLQNFLRDDIHTLGKTTGALVRATLYLIRQSLVTPVRINKLQLVGLAGGTKHGFKESSSGGGRTRMITMIVRF